MAHTSVEAHVLQEPEDVAHQHVLNEDKDVDGPYVVDTADKTDDSKDVVDTEDKVDDNLVVVGKHTLDEEVVVVKELIEEYLLDIVDKEPVLEASLELVQVEEHQDVELLDVVESDDPAAYEKGHYESEVEYEVLLEEFLQDDGV